MNRLRHVTRTCSNRLPAITRYLADATSLITTPTPLRHSSPHLRRRISRFDFLSPFEILQTLRSISIPSSTPLALDSMGSPAKESDRIPDEARRILKSLAAEWSDIADAEALQVVPLKGAMTNEVYQIRWLTNASPGEPLPRSRKVLVRIYGAGVEVFFDRENEIRTFEFMSRQGQGPRLLGRFSNGRVEEFIRARTLSAADLRDPEISALIAAKMSEFHKLDMPGPKTVVLWGRLRNWLKDAKRLSLKAEAEEFRFSVLEDEISELEKKLSTDHQLVGFCHNDLQYGNIMMDEVTKSITIIDYEYASYNHVAFDIANHFCEMAADYHTETPHVLDYSKYPDLEERRRFLCTYLSASAALITATSAASSTSAAAPIPANKTRTPPKPKLSPPTAPPPRTPSPPPPADIQGTHLNNIIDALIGAGDFAGWANLLSGSDPQSLPLTATFFIPGNDAVSNLSAGAGKTPLDAFLIPYHIVPQRLTFSDLRRLPARTRLPTLLRAKYIVVTNSSPENFAVDGSQVTHPDVFLNSVFSVHGVRKLLDYSVYGDGRIPSPPPPPPPSAHGLPEGKNPSFPGEGNVISGAAFLCSWVWNLFPAAVCASLLLLEIYWELA
ncbi:Probable choline kinase 2 [Striga hermonthica]|uniref:Probable choline kinase 2 n=1 Tax=Striga hermonthica TaxID=68872 RepID=A0A9N7N6E2_STRHE|nr:Probable choline kinase 2 [Striga hermonthica]